MKYVLPTMITASINPATAAVQSCIAQLPIQTAHDVPAGSGNRAIPQPVWNPVMGDRRGVPFPLQDAHEPADHVRLSLSFHSEQSQSHSRAFAGFPKFMNEAGMPAVRAACSANIAIAWIAPMTTERTAFVVVFNDHRRQSSIGPCPPWHVTPFAV
jgi:hypothetical protein